MDALMHLTGYLVSVMAAAGIVAAVEAFNERRPHAPFRRGERIAVPIKARSDAGLAGLRRRAP
jgi:hypothetical protein